VKLLVVVNFYFSQFLNTRNRIKQDVNGFSLDNTVVFTVVSRRCLFIREFYCNQ
jgi:hypothetical protein